MAKQYYDVYIRPAGTALTPLPSWDHDNYDDFYKLELLREKPKFVREPELTPLGDGTQRTDSEKVSIDCGTLEVDKTTYAFFRSTFHNKPCDIMMIPQNIIANAGPLSQSSETSVIVHNLTLQISKVVESGSSIICSIVGSRSYGVSADKILIIDRLEGPSMLVISGHVYKIDGVTPVPGVVVAITLDGALSDDTTDANGYYLIVNSNLGAGKVTATKTGWVFPDSPEISNDPEGYAFRHDFVATTEGA